MRDVSVAASLTEGVYHQLRADLLSCRIRPGEKLNLRHICTRLDASTGAVREAVARLVSDGLVDAAVQRGYWAAPVSVEALINLTQARVEIEILCLRESILNRSITWESELLAAGYMLANTQLNCEEDAHQVSDDWTQSHKRFHQALVSACPNPYLLQMRDQLYAQSERYRQMSVSLAESERDMQREHRLLQEAVIARDIEGAAASIRSHLEETTRIIIENTPAEIWTGQTQHIAV